MESRLGSLEGAYHQVADRLNSIDARLARVDARFDYLDSKIDRGFMWLMGTLIGMWVTIFLAGFSATLTILHSTQHAVH
ncbi:MAG TPA: hypothetical protein VIN40_06590 [Candidatus Tyrphobacter sp.]